MTAKRPTRLVAGLASVAAAVAVSAVPLDTAAAEAVAPDIDVAVVQGYLASFQQIAEANGGNRATGTSGYDASVDFVRGELEAAGYTVTEQEFGTGAGTSTNVLAELPGTDPDEVLMLGAHLDSVDVGPGINDNASGSAAELATAVALAQGEQPAATIRFSWWGAEEDGLLGSSHYVDTAEQTELDRISGYLNVDMIGSPNAGYFVYDDDPEIEATFQKFFADKGIVTEPETEGDGRSDHAPFDSAGVPVGGLFSGADWEKTAQQAEAWGGQAGQPFDPCYHAACDTTENIDVEALDTMSDALANAAWTLSGPAA